MSVLIAFTLRIPGGRESVACRRCRHHPDLHGSARHYRGRGRATLHCRRPFGHGRRRRMGHYQLPRRQRRHPADQWLAFGASRAPQLLPDVDSHLHAGVRTLRNVHKSRPADRVSRLARFGGRRPAALQSRRAAGRLSSGEAGHRDDVVWPRCPVGAGRRSDPRGLDHGQLFLALGVLHQRPRWSAGAWRLLCLAAGSRLSHGAAQGVEKEAAAL